MLLLDMDEDPQAASASAAPKRARKQTSPDVDVPIKLDESLSPNSKRRKIILGRAALDEASPEADGGASANGSPNAASHDAAGSSSEKFPRLPMEIWLNIFGFIPRRDTATISAVSRVSKAFHQAASPLLYRELVATAPSRGNIGGFIKQIEPFLSVRQLKELHPIKRLAGQNREYPTVADENAVPYCALHLKRLLVGWSNPGDEHVGNLGLYLERLLANATNIDTLLWIDGFINLTPEIGARIASLKLKAFAFSFCIPPDQYEPPFLRDIKNLTYLDIYLQKSHTNPNAVRELILGSHETLETLIYEEGSCPEDAIVSLDGLLSDGGKTISLKRLTHLCVRPSFLTKADARRLLDAIDFAQLTYLEFSTTGTEIRSSDYDDDEEEEEFTPHEPRDSSHQVLFQELHKKYVQGTGSERLALKTFRCRSNFAVNPDKDFLSLLSSFDTLETFIFEQTGHQQVMTRSKRTLEDPDALIQAIRGHQNLRWLGINVISIIKGCWEINTVNLVKIRDAFPKLRHLSCVGSNAEPREFGGTLATFPKLSCYHYPDSRWTNQPTILGIILQPFLTKLAEESSSDKYQAWEHKYNLSMVVINDTKYEVASTFPKTRKGKGRKQPVGTFSYDGRTVCYRPLPLGDVYDGGHANFFFMMPQEWRIRNYNSTKSDWLQGIKF
ncbi:hypothetical protein Dda_8676 [Drechslerella dactyloides]|uniref:F-box domain-containing protein n=1 Tax=Drechslerella dactyloides TaxID=74499 RepID=A0AAD6NHI6_DREDA|nr:hypothetical protein Dda_8676 [Drechslerella dactyloides]